MTCHRQPPPGVHTLAAHLNCNASGCHDEPVTEHLTETRNICLVCHRDKVNHEPGKICAHCHEVRPPSASAGSAKKGAPAGKGAAAVADARVPTIHRLVAAGGRR